MRQHLETPLPPLHLENLRSRLIRTATNPWHSNQFHFRQFLAKTSWKITLNLSQSQTTGLSHPRASERDARFGGERDAEACDLKTVHAHLAQVWAQCLESTASLCHPCRAAPSKMDQGAFR
jgi:hypothetical protein